MGELRVVQRPVTAADRTHEVSPTPTFMVVTEDEDRLTELVKAARDASVLDSNDVEIEALTDALDEALLQLGREDLRV
ncbi:hypothetical protein D1871_11315 [Nakamurella silvestris]|nr:hypothetical protein D1871_11315 [Nakamurella silvestris]